MHWYIGLSLIAELGQGCCTSIYIFSHWLSLLYTLYILSETDCGIPPSIDNGRAIFFSTLMNSTVNYFCFDGYTLHGGAVCTCESSALWSGCDPSCWSKRYS